MTQSERLLRWLASLSKSLVEESGCGVRGQGAVAMLESVREEEVVVASGASWQRTGSWVYAPRCVCVCVRA